MALILIVITNQIRYIRINKKIGYKKIDERYSHKRKVYRVYSPSYILVLKRNNKRIDLDKS